MFDTVEKINNILNKLDRLDSITLYGDAEEVVTKELLQEIRFQARKWERTIRKNFNEYFLKQANIAVLDKKKKEITED